MTGLTEFLVNQHYKRIGVLSKHENTLFDFWKKYVSAAYRQRRQQKKDELGMSYKTQKSQKENIVDKSQDNSVLNQYKKFENLFEMDVKYTIQKDLEEEHDDFKKTQLS